MNSLFNQYRDISFTHQQIIYDIYGKENSTNFKRITLELKPFLSCTLQQKCNINANKNHPIKGEVVGMKLL